MSPRLGLAQVAAVVCVLGLGASQGHAQEEAKPAEPTAPGPASETPPEELPTGADSSAEAEAEPEEGAEPEAAPQQDLQGLVAARAAIEEAQFATALESLEAAVKEGRAEPHQLEEIYRLQGETLAAIGKSDIAKESFKLLLLLNPDASLGEFASPKIVAVLEEARSDLQGGTLAARHTIVPNSRRLEVIVDSDPLQMSSKVRLSYSREDGTVANLSIPVDAGKAIFDLPAQAQEGVQLALLDRYGNAIVRWTVADLPPSIMAAAPNDGTSQGSALWARWWVWAGAGGAFAVLGTTFGVASSSAQSDLDEVTKNPGEHFLSEAKSLEDKAKSRATIANISFVMAGALGVTAGVMYWRGRNAEAALQVVPTDNGEGASIVMSGSF